MLDICKSLLSHPSLFYWFHCGGLLSQLFMADLLTCFCIFPYGCRVHWISIRPNCQSSRSQSSEVGAFLWFFRPSILQLMNLGMEWCFLWRVLFVMTCHVSEIINSMMTWYLLRTSVSLFSQTDSNREALHHAVEDVHWLKFCSVASLRREKSK